MIARLRQCEREIEMGFHVVRLEANGLALCRDRIGKAAFRP